jgi:uncharacterized protein YkwD
MRHHSAIIVVATTLGLVALGCGGGGGSSPTSPSSNNGLAQIEHASYRLVNVERDAAHVDPTLGGDPELSAIARAYSEEMRDQGFFSHTSPAGRTLAQRLVEAGYRFTYAGENLARVSGAGDPASYAHTLLMDNPSHRGNILGTQFAKLGVGVAFEGRTVWITQIYASR